MCSITPVLYQYCPANGAETSWTLKISKCYAMALSFSTEIYFQLLCIIVPNFRRYLVFIHQKRCLTVVGIPIINLRRSDEFQRYPLKFHTKYLPIHWRYDFLCNVKNLRALRFTSSYAFFRHPLLRQFSKYLINTKFVRAKSFKNIAPLYCIPFYQICSKYQKSFKSDAITPFGTDGRVDRWTDWCMGLWQYQAPLSWWININ